MSNSFQKYSPPILMFIALLLSSCEKVINLKFEQTSPKIVIEAIFTDLEVKHLVTLSNAKNFDDDNKRSPISGASVILKEENGQTIAFIEQGKSGNYYSSPFKGKAGKKYTLSVTSNGKTYSATSIMPMPVAIKFLNQIELTFFGETRKLVQVNYMDPVGIENFYYYKTYVNSFKRGSLNIESDRFNDGREVKNNIFVSDPDLKIGDKVKVQLLTIDKNVYNYLFTLSQISGNGGPPTTPANPTSNFSNGALGYFSASTLSVDSLTIK